MREFPGNKINNHLATNLKEAALSCWHLFSLKGYARVDVRTDNNDNVFVIEIMTKIPTRRMSVVLIIYVDLRLPCSISSLPRRGNEGGCINLERVIGAIP